jgi:predicted transcriptional regulator
MTESNSHTTTIRLSKKLYSRLESIAIHKGLTIEECGSTAITEYLTAEEKEDGYDEWLHDRLVGAIKKLDSGEMQTHTIEEVSEHLRLKRLERRKTHENP